MTEAERIAGIMRGVPNRTTFAPQRIEALSAFPKSGLIRTIRATVHMRYNDFRRLREDGLIEGETQRARLTPLGLAVRKVLEANQEDG